MRCELLNVKRSHNKFKSFSRSQKSIAYFAKKITHRLRKECKETEKEGVVLIGDGTFNPGGTGQAAVPKKAFIRQFATMYPVIITNEFRTSKLHPLSFTELSDIKTDKDTKDIETDKDTTTKERLRQCKTESGNSKVDDIMLKALTPMALNR